MMLAQKEACDNPDLPGRFPGKGRTKVRSMEWVSKMFRNQYLVTSGSPASGSLGDDRHRFGEFWVHAREPLALSLAHSGATSVCLLGDAIDPFAPDAANSDIAERIARSCDDLDDLWAALRTLSGRFVLIFECSTAAVVVGDACHFRQIYYSFIDNSIVFTSSPKFFLDYHGFNLESSAAKSEFMNTTEFLRSESAWVGDQSIDDRLHKLIPNHYLDLRQRAVKRLPVGESSESSGADGEDEVLEYGAQILRGTIAGLKRRYSLLQPLTAGIDSRILLAAAREYRNDIQFYVFDRLGDRRITASDDVSISKALADQLGLKFAVWTAADLRPDFLEEYRQEHVAPRVTPLTADLQLHYDLHRGRFVNVNGNSSEIVRCVYGTTPGPVRPSMLAELSGYGRGSAFSREQLAAWYRDAVDYSKESKVPLLDLFYWEQRMGNWGAAYPAELDIAIEEISPFNNRAYFDRMFTVSSSQRRAPDWAFFRRLAEAMWPEVLAQPINPSVPQLRTRLVKQNSHVRYVGLRMRRALREFRAR